MLRSMRSSLAALALPVICAAFLGSIPLRAEDPAPVCDATTLKGNYSLQFSGTVYDADWSAYILIEVGLATFDGAGNITGSSTFNFDGATFKRKFTGTYTINSDCTGTVTIDSTGNTLLSGTDKFTTNGDIVVIQAGNEFSFSQTDKGWMLYGTVKKQ